MSSRAASPEERREFVTNLAEAAVVPHAYLDEFLDDLARAIPGCVSVSALIGRDHTKCCQGTGEVLTRFVDDDGAMHYPSWHLACWCPLNAPCHADLLLDLANVDDSSLV